MTAAALDRVIQFERFALVNGPFGPEEQWQLHGGPVFALRQDVKDIEKFQAAQVQATISTRFHVRDSEFTRDIDARDRLYCDGRRFEITGTKQVFPGRRQLIEISAVTIE